MRGVAERAEVGVMRRGEKHAAARREHAMKLFHGADHVRDVLDHMDRAQLTERIVAKRVRKTVEIAKHIGAGIPIAIHADGARVFVDAAADVENPGGYATSFRHSSSVSTANSA